jgi:hypothetical protein
MEQHINKPIVVNDVSVRLVNVLTDSRCPEGVTCIRAGEAKVVVEIVKGGEIRDTKELIIEANTLMNTNSLIFKDEFNEIYAVDLLPYPVYNTKVIEGNYILRILAK